MACCYGDKQHFIWTNLILNCQVRLSAHHQAANLDWQRLAVSVTLECSCRLYPYKIMGAQLAYRRGIFALNHELIGRTQYRLQEAHFTLH